jgi:putative glutamine amidotransferase
MPAVLASAWNTTIPLGCKPHLFQYSAFSGANLLNGPRPVSRLPLQFGHKGFVQKERMMAARPLIGLNAEYRASKKDTPAFSFLAAGYYNALIKSGAIPLIIPPLVEEEDVGRVLDHLDGVVLTGGSDLDPRLDGYMLHPAMRLLDPRREAFDRKLVRQAAERRLPILGIGCGMQLLNVSLGGNLFFHLPEDLPRALPHVDAMDPNHRHALVVEPGSLMERVYGEGEIRVNSVHHMAVDEPAPGFAVTARCPDGVIEAIESQRSDWFAFGTQFHPESDSATALDLRIFEEFIAGITGESVAGEDMRMVA